MVGRRWGEKMEKSHFFCSESKKELSFKLNTYGLGAVWVESDGCDELICTSAPKNWIKKKLEWL